MKFKRFISILFVFLQTAGMIWMAPTALASSLHLVSVGDSIPNGYGLADPETAYPVLLANRLAATADFLTEDGKTSTGMLADLKKTNYKSAIRQADVVLLSIGGNDFLSLLSYTEISEFFRGNPEGLYQLANGGVAILSENFPKILGKIRTLNKDAVIVIQTVFNPYAVFQAFTVLGIELSSFMDTQIERLNDIIRSYAEEEKGIYLCDVHDQFQNAKDDSFVNAAANPLNLDPHPSLRGHQAIADGIWEVLLKAGIAHPDDKGAFLQEIMQPEEKEPKSEPLPQDRNQTNVEQDPALLYKIGGGALLGLIVLGILFDLSKRRK
jgi:lysophospholipase L1-like esterase